MVNSKQILAEFRNSRPSVPVSDLTLRTWMIEFVNSIALGYSIQGIQGVRLAIAGDRFPKYKGRHRLVRLFGCRSGEMVRLWVENTQVSGDIPMDCCIPESGDHGIAAETIVIAESTSYRFAKEGSGALYDYAAIEVLATRYENGYPMIEQRMDTVAKSYLEWKCIEFERKLNRSSIPRSDVDMAAEEYKRALGIAVMDLSVPDENTLVQIMLRTNAARYTDYHDYA